MFVTVSTGVGLRHILQPQLNWLTPKTPCLVHNRGHISCISRVIANFLLKFLNSRYHGNGGWFETNFTNTVKLLDPENPLIGAGMGVVSPIQAEL